MAETAAYIAALRLIDAAHAEDPRRVTVRGESKPYELHYAQRMSHYLDLRAPEASQSLGLAVRAQHLRRWEVPRDSYPMTRAGYLSWRTFLKKRQADLAASMCEQAAVAEPAVERVRSLVRKENLKTDEETQILEDVACLVFLDDQFDAFEREHDEAKIMGIVRKTWTKMSERGHELALQIHMSERATELIGKALQPS